MDVGEALRARRSVRSFRPDPVPEEVLGRILSAACRAPTAGHTQGVDLVVLAGEETARYWDAALPPGPRRDRFGFPGLVRAPVLVLAVGDAGAYAARYREPDKQARGAMDATRWPVPYWHVDAGFALMLAWVAAVGEGLGGCFFGVFAQAGAVASALGLPGGRDPVGVLALGWPEPSPPGRSAGRARRPDAERIHRGAWAAVPIEEDPPPATRSLGR